MSRVVVIGGSAAGLLSAIGLAGRGHDVMVLERESADVVGSPADRPAFPRHGAPHAVQGHALLARASAEIRRGLPDVHDAFVRAGVGQLNLVQNMPPTIVDRSPRHGDDELTMLTSRRHTFDRVLVEAARSTSGLDLQFGVSAEGVVLTDPGDVVPRVTGVRTGSRQVVDADVVVDASGRRSPVPGWLAAQGIDLPVESWDCGLIYYTRHYRIRPNVARPPLNRIFGAGAMLPSLNVGWFPGDNDTAMLTHTLLAEDTLLKQARHTPEFVAIARAVPSVAPWLECADPITEVFAMGALLNTLRRTVHAGRPRVLGLHLVGDAACTTNPTLGRGLSFAAAFATRLAEIVDETGDPFTQALRLDDFVTREIEPRFRENAIFDRARVQVMRADLAQQAPPIPPPPAADVLRPDELLFAGMLDGDLFRESMRYSQLLTATSRLADASLIERVRQVFPPGTRPPPPVGPSRADLAQALAAASTS